MSVGDDGADFSGCRNINSHLEFAFLTLLSIALFSALSIAPKIANGVVCGEALLMCIAKQRTKAADNSARCGGRSALRPQIILEAAHDGR